MDIKTAEEKFYKGECDCAYKFMGCHKEKNGWVFRVWAPSAQSVALVGDFNFWNTQDAIMEKNIHGVWEILSVYAKEGDKYKYYVVGKNGNGVYKSDPYAKKYSALPDTSSLVYDIGYFKWTDRDYIKQKHGKNVINLPVNIYEVHLGSWVTKDDGSFYGYSEIADKLIKYIKKMHYTHVELLPITEYPFYPSWGYQVTGYFAPTFRFGTPEDFMSFVNKLHNAGIGVILDWVPAHFPKDESGLYEFDGSFCYEVADPEMNEHPDWNTRIFDYGRYEVRSFLLSSAVFWIKEYHIDGIRVDAVASMLYLDYGRKEYKPNKYGDNKNLEAMEFLKCLNKYAFSADPSVMMIAEESTAFPLVTKPADIGGLGFNFKWNMGWMNDMLGYMSTDPLFRKGKHNNLTFSLTYAFSENFILPLSHDETVHGKCSMIDKMPGNYDDKFNNLRVLYSYMMAHPGKKLSFMGNEFAQFIEWDFKKQLDWFLLDYEKHKKMQEFVKDLNLFYKNNPELWENDSDWNGFAWVIPDDNSQSVVAFKRMDAKGSEILSVFNFCPVERNNYRIGLPDKAVCVPMLCSDREKYGGSTKRMYKVNSEKVPMHGYNYSGIFNIPPMSAIYYKIEK